MEELKPRLILDGKIYKLSYTADGRQQKVSIKNEKDITLMAAKRIELEVTEIISAKYDYNTLIKMKQINEDALKSGYECKLLKYSTYTIELALRIMYPDEYGRFKGNEEQGKKNIVLNPPLEILNVGCTSAGKTLFILRNVLGEGAFKIFSQVFTSIKETTACSIVYHINSEHAKISKDKFLMKIALKDKEEIFADIIRLITEAFEEYIESIRNRVSQSADVEDLRKQALLATKKRLEMNCDKTFGLGTRAIVGGLVEQIELLIKNVMLGYYANSKSIERLAEADPNYLVRQLAENFRIDRNAISNDAIHTIVQQYRCASYFNEMKEKIYDILKNDLEEFNMLYACGARVGDEFEIVCEFENENTLLLLSHIFGNKRLQRKQEFFTIEPYVKCADVYVINSRFKGLERELILSDSVGVNQGQKDTKRLKEIALNRVSTSIMKRKPDIIIYHTKLGDKDDYMVDIVKNLNMEGYGKVTHIVAGRLDTILEDRIKSEGIEMEDLDESEFKEFMEEVTENYVRMDNITLEAMIGERYYICDKTNGLVKKLPYTSEYMATGILDRILGSYSRNDLKGISYNDEDFMNFIKKYRLCENVYTGYRNMIPNMIPMQYASMRWNTLQKGIERLYFNDWGFDVLCPALNVRKIIAVEFDKVEVNNAFEALFADKADDIKQRFLINVTEVAQIVLVTEFKNFMKTLLQMRYDNSARTDFSISMTDDRKVNLQYLYKNCLEDGRKGEYSMEMIFHIAWLRMIELISMEMKSVEN